MMIGCTALDGAKRGLGGPMEGGMGLVFGLGYLWCDFLFNCGERDIYVFTNSRSQPRCNGYGHYIQVSQIYIGCPSYRLIPVPCSAVLPFFLHSLLLHIVIIHPHPLTFLPSFLPTSAPSATFLIARLEPFLPFFTTARPCSAVAAVDALDNQHTAVELCGHGKSGKVISVRGESVAKARK